MRPPTYLCLGELKKYNGREVIMQFRRGFDPDSDLWDFVAAELRRQRQERNLSLAAVGDIINRDRSLVARVESGDTKLQEVHAGRLDHAWNLDGLFRRLVKFAKAGHDVEWFKTHLEMEANSSELRIWELGWLPGLFQTEDYARAVLTCSGEEDVEADVETRLARQDSLRRKPRPRIWVLLDQSVVEQPVGSPELMCEQLSRLVESARLPNITVRIVPREVGAHVGRDGSFKIMTEGGASAVFVAAAGGGRLVQDAGEIASYRTRFDLIGDVALPKEASLQVLVQTLEQFRDHVAKI
ncbi:helix-turn-helix transcriptional regulator [Spirillospora sp. NPDC047279]|uniref:helix-turn-helix domain-containing protein n=1 Tax=Spirillospora sp. NPDC047279 TaxID=3155478 RepID=UPI0033D58528